MLKGLSNLGNVAKMLKRAQKVQEQVAEFQERLKDQVVEGRAGGGLVVAKVNGNQELVDIQIQREVVNPDELEMLQSLVLAAVRQATRKSREMVEDGLKSITGGMQLPGMP